MIDTSSTAKSTLSADEEAVRRHCGVFTRPAVVKAMLDAVGWRADCALESASLLEPACGDGAFVLEAGKRLCGRLQALGRPTEDGLVGRITAFEFDRPTAAAARSRVALTLQAEGLDLKSAERVARSWILQADFILSPPDSDFTHVVGNPPYMRWSRVGARLRKEYEAVLPAFAARGDLCVPFVWRSLELLRPGGKAALLCSDRWFRCGYGVRLREALARLGRLAAHFEAHGAPLFEGTREVRAYPAISVLERSPGAGPAFGRFSNIEYLADALRVWARRNNPEGETHHPQQTGTAMPALLAERDIAACARELMQSGVPLAQAGLQVRCGMALGCASAFLLDHPDEVEHGRQLPFAISSDIDGRVEVTNSRWIADVWSDEGRLVDLDDFPMLRARLYRFRSALASRACVGKLEEWHRTIDRKNKNVLAARRLVVAGMSRRARAGILPPGIALANSAYAVFGDSWPLDELHWLLRNGPLDAIALATAPRFGGATLRFDGNLLRRVPVPIYNSIDLDARQALRDAAFGSNAIDATEVVAAVYRMRDPVALAGLRRLHEEASA